MAVVLRALLPTPTTDPIATLLKTSQSNQKPGRASASQSWIDDKFMNQRKPGRATSSKSWVMDKIAPAMTGGERAGSVLSGGERAASDMGGGDRAGREESRIGWSAVKRPASRAPSTDRCDKKLKAAVEKEEGEQLFAGPTFMSVVPPDPSELPIPYYFMKKKRSSGVD